MAEEQTDKQFGDALRDLVLAHDGSNGWLAPNRNINWMLFVKDAMEPRGISYETLRKAQSGERHPSLSLMEKVSEALGVRPDYFAEYRLAQALQAFDVSEVGWDKAIENLRSWNDRQAPRRKKGR
jgi:hypothetical protein